MYLEYLGKYHRDIRVPRRLYTEWREALINSASRCHPDFDDELVRIWNDCINVGIENMLKAYDED